MNSIRPLFLILALLAEIIGTIGGFGSSVFFVPLGNFYFDFYSVLGLTALFHLSSNVSKMMLFKKGIDKKILINLGVPAIVFVVIGGLASKFLDTKILQLSLAIFLLVFSSLFLIKKELVVKASAKNAVIGGSLSGFSAGLLGTGGAIRGLTMAAFNLEKNVFIATSALIDLLIDFSRTIVYWKNGYIHQHDLIYLPFLLVIGFVGSYIGKQILRHIPQPVFRKISLILILIIGLVSLYSWVNPIVFKT